MITPQQLLAKANDMRKAKGLNPFTWDDRLAKSAQGHADDLAAGRASPHENLEGRLKSAGWPISNFSCLVSRRTQQANYSEGIVGGGGSVDEMYIEYLVSSNDDHTLDFYDKLINLIGIGVAQGRSNQVVLDYGRDCTPVPVPPPPPQPEPALPYNFFSPF